MHEILTLQFGSAANHLGTHFWNTQESYFTYSTSEDETGDARPPPPVDHDVHFRPGIAPDGSDTFTPRALIYDLKESFGGLRGGAGLYEEEGVGEDMGQGVWNNPSSTPIRAPPITPSPYQTSLNAGETPTPLTPSTVRYWSDYNHLFYHPKSLIPLSPSLSSSTPSTNTFNQYSTGAELFQEMDAAEDLLDRDLRWWVEECDQLQGVQVITGTGGAWGGWAGRWVERIRDELGKGLSIWAWGIDDQDQWVKKGADASSTTSAARTALLNSALSLNQLAAHASLYIPLATPSTLPKYLTSFDPHSQYHVSALQAIAFETATLPSRLKRSNAARASMAELEEVVTRGVAARNVVSVGWSVRDPAAAAEEQRKAEQPKVVDLRDKRSVWEAYGALDLKPKKKKKASTTELGREEVELFGLGVPKGAAAVARKRRRGERKEHVFGSAETWRGEWEEGEQQAQEEDDEEEQLRKGWDESAPRIERYRIPTLPLPIQLSSYPRIFGFTDGSHEARKEATEKLALRAALTTRAGVAEEIGRLTGVVRRLGGVEDREALIDGLEGLREGFVEGGEGEDDDDDEE